MHMSVTARTLHLPSQPLEPSVAAVTRVPHLINRRHAHDGLLGGEVERAADDINLLLATPALLAGRVRWVLTWMHRKPGL
jgi:hypothetical protein